MLPTNPRPVVRSTWSSCTTPCCRTATRVSCGVTLMRISSSTALAHGTAEAGKQLAGFEQGQTHHTRVAAAQIAHERRSSPLNRIRAGLVHGFTGADVGADLVCMQAAELDGRGRDSQLEAGVE